MQGPDATRLNPGPQATAKHPEHPLPGDGCSGGGGEMYHHPWGDGNLGVLCPGGRAASFWGHPGVVAGGEGTPAPLSFPPVPKAASSRSRPSQIPGRLMSNRQRGAGPRSASSGCFCVLPPAAAPRAVFVQGWGPGGAGKTDKPRARNLLQNKKYLQ